MNKRLDNLTEAVRNAEEAVVQELERQFPVGSLIRVRAQTNHRKPSSVTVVAAIGGNSGLIRVEYIGGHRTAVSYKDVVE